MRAIPGTPVAAFFSAFRGAGAIMHPANMKDISNPINTVVLVFIRGPYDVIAVSGESGGQ